MASEDRMKSLCVGVDVGGTNIAVALVNQVDR